MFFGEFNLHSNEQQISDIAMIFSNISSISIFIHENRNASQGEMKEPEDDLLRLDAMNKFPIKASSYCAVGCSLGGVLLTKS